MTTKLTYSQGAALDQLYAGRGYACGAGITNSTNSALQRRGFTRIETTHNRGGWWNHKWKLTDKGVAEAQARAKARKMRLRPLTSGHEAGGK